MALINTGFQRIQEKDVNPNSPTFGQTRWIESSVQDLEACPPPFVVTYPSREISEIVFRDNCESDQGGGSVVYILPAGHYVSTISQAEADSNAREYFDSTKQQYANDHATCGGVDDCGDPGPPPVGDGCIDSAGNFRTATLCTSSQYPYCQYWSCEGNCNQ